MYVGTEAQPDLMQYCSIKVLEYHIHNIDPVNYPDRAVLMISKLEVVKTAEVRLLPKENFLAEVLLLKHFFNFNSAKRKQKNWKSRTMEK